MNERQAYNIDGWSNLMWYKTIHDLGTSRNVTVECPALPTDAGKPTTATVPRRLLVPVGAGGIPVPPAPTSRTSDPATSKAAAAMQTPARMRDVYWIILELLWEADGPLNDFELSDAAKAKGMNIIPTSIGKRRLELQRMGYLDDAGTVGPSHTNSDSTQYRLTNAGREIVKGAVA